MASTGINFTNLTAPNHAVDDLRKLLLHNLAKDPAMTLWSTLIPKVVDGTKLGVLNGYGLMGLAATCSPTYGNASIATSEKEWDIADFEIAEKICYKDLEGKLVEKAFKNGTSAADLTGSDYVDLILMPYLKKAWYRAIFRLVWFADQTATNYDATDAPHGTLNPGVNKDFFTLTNGLWKQIFTGVASGTISRTAVTANTAATTALQKSGIRTAGVAEALLDNIIDDAPVRLKETPLEDRVMLVSQGLYDAARRDVKNSNKGSELQFKSWFAGIQATKWDGITLIAMPMWDELLALENNDTYQTAALNMPYRAVYTTKDNLVLGTRSEAMTGEISVVFDPITKLNYIRMEDTIGSLVADDSLIHVAY